MPDQEELHQRLIELKTEHRDLDMAIATLLAASGYDPLQVQRLKKRKLALKDLITRLESYLLPDIIA
ncbi:MAG: DUF465 domain-containing protein [Alphaproteobacteria bacterium]|nr:DUF465 domain-containing protein [Alphaproteobacteria bacterium]